MKILADASLPGLPHAFPAPFDLSLYEQASDLHTHLHGQSILLCRSTLHVDESLLEGHLLRYVATASSGTDHIDHHSLEILGIQLLDAKGSNATAVADYVVSCVAYLQKYEQFSGLKAGIIGMGAVGSKVAQRLQTLNFDVISYDPPKTKRDADYLSCSMDELLDCDLICVHANLHDNAPDASRNLLNKSFLKKLKPGTAIINASRGEIVNEDDLLSLDNPILYCTDVFTDEPEINEKIVDYATLCTPHIAGHSQEAKYRAVQMISEQLHHHYHLRLPEYDTVKVSHIPEFKPGKSWQDYVLSLFNPVDDTVGLKLANDKTEAFIKLRKAHLNRHDFYAYDHPALDDYLKMILGCSL